MRRAVVIVGFSLVFLLALTVALTSARYLLPVPASPASLMILHLERWTWAVVIHVAGGITALALGPLQLITRRGKRLAWHRVAGWVYVLACLSSAVAGFWLALHSIYGPIASTGFVGLAVSWFFATAMGWRKAIERSFVEHRRWMIRSVALTFSAVTLRILLPLSPMSGLGFDDAYRVVSFLCWIPNLLMAELYLHWKRPAGGRPVGQSYS